MPTPGERAGPSIPQKSDRGRLAREQVRALGVAEGFFSSQILFALNELGVFDALSDRSASVADLARALSTSEDGLERLLHAGVAVGLVQVDEGHFSNSELAAAVLVTGGEGYIGNWMRLLSRYARVWAELPVAVRSGERVVDPARFLGGDADDSRDFVLAMDDYARVRGSEVVEHLHLRDGDRVLDLGGGSGSYALMFAERWPEVRVTVFDLPDVARVAEERIRAAGLADRVTAVGGDFYRDPLGADFDVVFLSDTLHQAGPEDASRILRSAHGALRPGGRIVVQAMLLNEDRSSPRWSTILSLLMLLVYGSGRAYTIAETLAMLEQSGFVGCAHERMSLLTVNSLVTGTRPPAPGATPTAPHGHE